MLLHAMLEGSVDGCLATSTSLSANVMDKHKKHSKQRPLDPIDRKVSGRRGDILIRRRYVLFV